MSTPPVSRLKYMTWDGTTVSNAAAYALTRQLWAQVTGKRE